MILAYKETKDFLKRQMNGITGHIEVAGYPFDSVEWGKEDKIGKDEIYTWGDTWWAYEQTAYWVDGLPVALFYFEINRRYKRRKKSFIECLKMRMKMVILGPNF